MWCGPCLRLRVGVSSCVGGGVVGSAEGREEMVTHQLTAHTARVNSTVVTNKKCCMYTQARTHGLLAPHCHPNVHMRTQRDTQA